MKKNKHNKFNFKNHLSASLKYMWRYKDFKVSKVIQEDSKTILVWFKPKYKILLFIINCITRKKIPVSGYLSFRLVFISSIIGAGYTLKKDKKDGEVIVRDFKIEYEKPILYNFRSKVIVRIETSILKKNSDYLLYETKFFIGNNREHFGKTKLYYCNPALTKFSYL